MMRAHEQRRYDTPFNGERRPILLDLVFAGDGETAKKYDHIIKTTVETLAASEEKFRHIFESANDAIMVMDRNVITDCNAQAMEIFGYAREQIIGQTPYRLSPDIQPDGEESIPGITDYVAKAYDGQAQMFNWQFVRGDEELFFAEVSLNSFISSRRRYILAVIRDITDIRKQWEEYKNLYTNLQDTFVMVADHTEKMNALGAEKMEEVKESMGKALDMMKRRRLDSGRRQDNRQADDATGNDAGALQPVS
ncbi:MAG: PAS domain S-box protein [Syntrophus sp. (in: bacteria)]